ncbi:leucine zipper domain-containing protein [Geothrix sp. PMB-07]|nr:helix-turn-helix domain-containing protein [Geothrix sp. PMB-07]WLT31931.1 leucine zipper domain-containing protein [Geothrix sp. PMB-07]
MVRRVRRLGWTVKQAAQAAGISVRTAYKWLARRFGMPRSTVGLILRRKGLSRWSALEKKEPPRRYEIAEPVGLLHLDIKKLERIQGVGHRIHGDRRTRQRGIGWEHLHIAINAHSRSSYDEVLPDERKETTAAFLQRALFHYASQGVQEFITPHTPEHNGLCERIIRTLKEQASTITASNPSSTLPASLATGLTSITTGGLTKPPA